MKKTVLGLLLFAVLGVVALTVTGFSNVLFAQTRPIPTSNVGSNDLIVLPLSSSDKGEMMAMIDSRQRVIAVYHIEAVTGKITLKSVRNVNADLQMNYLNNNQPLPQEIQSLLQQH